MHVPAIHPGLSFQHLNLTLIVFYLYRILSVVFSESVTFFLFFMKILWNRYAYFSLPFGWWIPWSHYLITTDNFFDLWRSVPGAAFPACVHVRLFAYYYLVIHKKLQTRLRVKSTGFSEKPYLSTNY